MQGSDSENEAERNFMSPSLRNIDVDIKAYLIVISFATHHMHVIPLISLIFSIFRISIALYHKAMGI